MENSKTDLYKSSQENFTINKIDVSINDELCCIACKHLNSTNENQRKNEDNSINAVYKKNKFNANIFISLILLILAIVLFVTISVILVTASIPITSRPFLIIGSIVSFIIFITSIVFFAVCCNINDSDKAYIKYIKSKSYLEFKDLRKRYEEIYLSSIDREFLLNTNANFNDFIVVKKITKLIKKQKLAGYRFDYCENLIKVDEETDKLYSFINVTFGFKTNIRDLIVKYIKSIYNKDFIFNIEETIKFIKIFFEQVATINKLNYIDINHSSDKNERFVLAEVENNNYVEKKENKFKHC